MLNKSVPFFREKMRQAADVPRLLVRYPNWVGDAVMALPALEMVRLAAPEARLAVLAKPWVADVVEMSGLADEVLRYERPGRHAGFPGMLSLVRELRRRAFHGALLFQNAFEAAFLARTACIPLRGGYASQARRLLLTHPVATTPGDWPLEHQVGYYVDMVRALGFNAPVGEVPRIRLEGVPDSTGPGAGAKTLALAPGASYGPAKMWPRERYAELGRRFASRGWRVLVLGSAGETETCRAVVEGIGPGAEDLSGRTTLKEAAAVLARAGVAVSNDSGLMHLAAAVGAPLVAIFGSTDPKTTGPVSDSSRVLVGGVPCAPCFRRECDRPEPMGCFDKVTVDMVEAACLELLGRPKER